MTLHETVQEAKAQMTREIVNSFAELEAEAKVIDRLKTQCQRSHRCWPSLTMFGVLIGLLVVHWCLASWQAEELVKEVAGAKADLQGYLDQQIAALTPTAQIIIERVPQAPRHWWSRR